MFRRPLAAALLLIGTALLEPCSASPDSVVVFNEVHYNPSGTSEAGEWIEVFNQMGIKVDVSGWRIDGVGYTFPAGTILNPGTYRVIAKTPGAGQLGPYTGTIDNGGETLRLINQSNRMMDELNIDDNAPWPTGPDGSGGTLAKLLPYTSSTPHGNWAASSQTNGTPGTVNFPSPPTLGGVRFNEIESAGATGFWLELTNTSAASVDIGNMVVSLGGDPLYEHVISSATLAPGGFIVLTEATLGFKPASGEKLFLYNSGKTALIDSREATNRLRGRSGASDGAWHYPSTATPGAANTFAFSSAAVISEIQYNPPSLPATLATPAIYQTVSLVGYNDIWRYNSSNDSLPSNWAAVSHAATGNWKSGAGPVGVENAMLAVPLVTTITPYAGSTVTHYFEREFSLTQAQLNSTESIEITHQIDDGAVFYLNGTELAYRFNMAAGAVNPETQASPSVANAVLVSVSLPTSGLVAGTNRISVEVHQYGTTSSDLVFGMKMAAKLLITPGIPGLPMRVSNNQWLEIANRSANPIDLNGWRLEDGVDFGFTAGSTLAPGEHACVVRDAALFAAAHPGARVLGTFTGSLARSGENLILSDAFKNPVDEVRYFDGGQWPEYADGGGSSLELRDLDADNSQGGAWAASDESGRTAWKTYAYRGTAAASNGPDSQWSEFNFGMLAAGEIWIDDVNVIEFPDGAATQKIVDTGFNNAALWRRRGNHRHSQIISEPGNPGNKILRLVATGPTEHMHNQIETTLASAITNGRDYQVSFRARWVTGISQLHSRLYFNRLARLNVVDRPADPGTPSASNSRATGNAGPTFSSLKHSPAVPAASQATVISAYASDPENIAAMTLFYSVNGGAFANMAMTAATGGIYQGSIPGQGAGAVVQFYLRGTDSLGAVSFHPAAGAGSRALYKVNDGTAASNGMHNFRLITTNADRDFMHTSTEVMSNDRIEATVIDREGEIYYGTAVRLKSSERGRNNLNRVGYSIDFPPDGLFRGAHAGLAVDRSEGQLPGQRELLFDMMISNSGGPISRYNDFIKVLAPNSALTGSALLQMARYEDVFLDEQFDNGADGTLYEYELVYYPTTADAAGAKLPSPDLVNSVTISDLGTDPERYRWHFLNKINREADRYDPIISYCKLFSMTGSAFETALPAAVDLDTWLRGMAYAVLSGAGDNAAAGSGHNGIYYAKPDGRVIFLPHDMDYSFDAARSIFANGECSKLTANPARRRLYLGHLHDIISTTYNNSYMSIWTTHFAALDPAQDWATELTYMTNRSNNVLSQINTQIASVAYGITTPSPLTVGGSSATITGNGWVNVRDIRIAGSSAPLVVTWTGNTTWQVTVPVAPGRSTVTLEAVNFAGTVIGSASIVINSSTIIEPGAAGNLVVSEIMYHPAEPDAEEVTAGFTDAEQFEYVEVMNSSANEVNLTGVRFTGDLDYSFAPDTSLASGARIIVARNRSAFLARYPSAAGSLAAGAFLNSSGLNNSNDTIVLVGAAGGGIQNFTYFDTPPWPLAADGDGHSLVLIEPATNPDHALASNWRASSLPAGNPGASDSFPFTGVADADADLDGLPALVEYALGTSDLGQNPSGITLTVGPDGYVTVSYERNLSADGVVCEIQSSADMIAWGTAFSVVSETPTGEGSVITVLRSTAPATERYFTRLAVRER